MDILKPCEYCGGTGLVPVYHRFYEGSQTVLWEHTDRHGEVHTIRSPGVVAAHCLCSKGDWIRNQTKEELLPRIPLLLDVLAGRTNYLRDDPTEEMLIGPEPSEHAAAFLRRWKAGLARFFQAPRKERVA